MTHKNQHIHPLVDVLAESGLLDDVDESILKGFLANGANLAPDCILPDSIGQVRINGDEQPDSGPGAS